MAGGFLSFCDGMNLYVEDCIANMSLVELEVVSFLTLIGLYFKNRAQHQQAKLLVF